MIFPPDILHNSGTTLTLDDRLLLLGFRQEISPADVQHLLEPTSVRLEELFQTQEQNGNQIKRKVNHTNRLYWIHSKDGKSILDDQLGSLRQQLQNKLLWVGAVLRYPPTKANPKGHPVCALPHVLLVKPKTEGSIGNLDHALAALGIQYQKDISPYLNGLRLYYIAAPSKNYVLPPSAAHDLQIKLLDDKYNDLVTAAYFDFMPMFVPTASPTSEAAGNIQWNLETIQTEPGWTTIPPGWTILDNPWKAGAGVRVAIIDDGIKLDHEDLSVGINTDLSATFATPMGPNTAVVTYGHASGGGSDGGNEHGTMCAGVLAARCNNNLGIAGLAGGCDIVSLKCEGSPASTFIAAVNYAAANACHVISYSNVEPSLEDPILVEPALRAVFESHKIVICAAAGNQDESDVGYPAHYKDLVIACGATTGPMNEKRCTGGVWSRSTGEGSNYGDALSVVAPGIGIHTCHYGGAYVQNFEGTSAATPHVAALAALIISAYPLLKGNPNLVRNIIERSADKVGTVTVADNTRYPGYAVGDSLPYSATAADPTKTWNWETGYGRINVREAMILASQVKKLNVLRGNKLVFVASRLPKSPIKDPPKPHKQRAKRKPIPRGPR